MPRSCQITGKHVRIGNNVSHANNKTKREFRPNLQTKKFALDGEGRTITLTLTAKAIKTIAKKGIHAVLKDVKRRTGKSL